VSFWPTLAQRLSAHTGRRFESDVVEPVAGGCIHRAFAIQGHDAQRYFVKLNETALLPMFEAEADGLRELASAQALRIPLPVLTGTAEGQAFLVLEYLAFGRGNAETDESFGRGLAALHRVTRTRFGWHRDNAIGATPQPNTWSDDWVEFYRERRLRAQIERTAGPMGARLRALGTALLERLPLFFATYRPAASLLHGDLWSGNTATTRAGEPAIFDPAVYFGDREADLAMTELFGGFSSRFYSAYGEAWPLDGGYSVRKTVYNLYHVLNHFNLFGGGYGTQAERMMQQLLSEVR